MANNNMKRGVLILIILCLIAIVAIGIVLVYLSKNKEEVGKNKIQTNTNTDSENIEKVLEPPEESIPEEMNLNKEIHKEDKTNVYFTVEKNIKNYITYLRVNNQNAINALSNGVSIFNTNGLSNNTTLSIKEMYSVDNDNGRAFFIRLNLSNNGDYTILLAEDFINGTFGIASITNDEYNATIAGKSSIDYTKHIDIPKNEYNAIQYVNLSNSEIAERYLKSYIQKARYSPEEAYNSLDEVYRNTRFGSFENFKTYLADKADELATLDNTAIKSASEFATAEEYTNYINNLNIKGLEKFDKYTDGDIEYLVCVDAYGNYYIFKISHVMEYKLMLDSYTINTPRFLEQYQTADEQGKTELNIRRIFEAIDNKDFKYVYEKLDENFKNTMFSNYEDFIKKMENNFFKKNSIEFDGYRETEEQSEYTLIVTDANKVESRELDIKMIMNFGNNTDYTIKFQ